MSFFPAHDNITKCPYDFDDDQEIEHIRTFLENYKKVIKKDQVDVINMFIEKFPGLRMTKTTVRNGVFPYLILVFEWSDHEFSGKIKLKIGTE
ncbi:MAG: hypothetical protein WBA59_04050 [Moheibacter sp.]